jgi:hypothetical protein
MGGCWQNCFKNLTKKCEYIGKKALKSGISEAIEKIAVEIGGRKLAQKLTEKAVLKLIVPGVIIPIAACLNKKFTSRLGQSAIKKFKTRGATSISMDIGKKSVCGALFLCMSTQKVKQIM